MKHWHPGSRTVERALGDGAERLVGPCSRPTTPASRSAATASGSRRPSTAAPSSSSWTAGTTTSPTSTSSPSAFAAPTPTFAGPQPAGADPRRGRPLPRPVPGDLGAWSPTAPASPTGRSPSRARARPASRLGPDILVELETLHERRVGRCWSLRWVRLRPSGDPVGPRRRGTRQAAGSGSSSTASSRQRRPGVHPRARGPRGEGLLRRKTNRSPMSTFPAQLPRLVLLEVAPDLHFKHYTLGEARLPAEVLVNLPDIPSKRWLSAPTSSTTSSTRTTPTRESPPRCRRPTGTCSPSGRSRRRGRSSGVGKGCAKDRPPKSGSPTSSVPSAESPRRRRSGALPSAALPTTSRNATLGLARRRRPGRALRHRPRLGPEGRQAPREP